MNDSDKEAFKNIFDELAEYYRQEPLGKIGLKIYFKALSEFSVDQIHAAAEKHIADTGSGQFFPKVADLIKHLQGGEITADMIIASARLHQTPLGVLSLISIGKWNLDNQDAFYLRQRAEECLQLLPEWMERASGGDYTDHEIKTMLKYGVNPLKGFFAGLAVPKDPARLIERSQRIDAMGEHEIYKALPAPASESGDVVNNPEVRQEIKELLKVFEDASQ